jgi:hypothetical protein
MTMKNAVFWYVTPYGFYKNRRFAGNCCIHHQGDKNEQLGTLAVTS